MLANLEEKLNANFIESLKKKTPILKTAFEKENRELLLKEQYCQKKGHVEGTKHIEAYGLKGPKVYYICERCLMPQERNPNIEELKEWERLITEPFTI